jgi:hypothetical protein
MSRCSHFVSAPTVRLLRTVEQLSLRPGVERHRLAAMVYSGIKPLVASQDHDALRAAAADVQDSRWRMIAAGTGEDDLALIGVRLVEQWLLARTELARPKTPVMEVLAGKRAEVIERFVRDHLSFESGEVIYLSEQVAAADAAGPLQTAAA